MERNKKITIIVACIIILAMLIAILTVKLIKLKKIKNEEIVDTSVNVVEDIDELENEVKNEVNENIEIENAIDSSEDDNESNNVEVAPTEQEISRETIEKGESNKEKAINIAKNDWGENGDVYFSFDEEKDNKYTVVVREANTTRAIRYYHININDGTFEIEE